jgi:hypothetical protein
MVRTGATFADAAAEYLRYIGDDRARKASTVEDYRSIMRVHLLPAFGEMPIESVTAADVEAFVAQLGQREHCGRPITLALPALRGLRAGGRARSYSTAADSNVRRSRRRSPIAQSPHPPFVQPTAPAEHRWSLVRGPLRCPRGRLVAAAAHGAGRRRAEAGQRWAFVTATP